MSNPLKLIRMSTSSNFEPLNENPDSAPSESNNLCENPKSQPGAEPGMDEGFIPIPSEKNYIVYTCLKLLCFNLLQLICVFISSHL